MHVSCRKIATTAASTAHTHISLHTEFYRWIFNQNCLFSLVVFCFRLYFFFSNLLRYWLFVSYFFSVYRIFFFPFSIVVFFLSLSLSSLSLFAFVDSFVCLLAGFHFDSYWSFYCAFSPHIAVWYKIGEKVFEERHQLKVFFRCFVNVRFSFSPIVCYFRKNKDSLHMLHFPPCIYVPRFEYSAHISRRNRHDTKGHTIESVAA